MNWYKKAKNDFQKGEAVALIEIHPNSNMKLSDLDGVRYYVDEDEQTYYLSQYPVSFGDRKGNVHQYSKKEYTIERV